MNDFTFADIFSLSMSPLQVIVTLLMALVVGGFICFVYKKTFGGVMYSRNFNLSLIVLTMVTALMLMLINNSLALSLGMVGALSIIRFRTAIKDPMDTVFMFWSVGEGIAIGTKFYDIAIISAIIIGVVLAALYVLATTALGGPQDWLLALFTAAVQGLLCAAGAVYANQCVKQKNKSE